MTVVAHHLQRDGKAWRPRGLSMIGSLTEHSAVAAASHWGPAERTAAKSWGVDTFRFQAAQPYLDPQDAKHSAAYLTRLKGMVTDSLADGFVVILSMQDQSLAGGNADPTPTQSTVRAWNALAPSYINEPRVMFELYNEPDTLANTAGWAVWKDGDAANGLVGHQALLTQLRSLGAINVILADGAQKAEILPATNVLNDPLQRLAYAVHPYFLGPAGQEVNQWNARFGNLSASVPVVVSEWDNYSGGSCNPNAPTLVPMLLSYLRAHDIGMYGWAFDLPGTLIQDWNWTPTNLTNYVCSPSGTGGSGALLKADFLAP